MKDVMRVNAKPLTDRQKGSVELVKERGNDFAALLDSLPANREMSIAKTKLEECIMWAVKGITA